ncbi:hypothetical protein QOZ80_6BG0473530 [Eleusine coracana subsp. coracana]|nr:hypothetical protein QOZ80_6BG0473530 [Eleusine coracana subsp. coracana]
MKREGFEVASIQAIDIRQDTEKILETMGSERKLRFIVTKKEETERYVNITPLKNLWHDGLAQGPSTDHHDINKDETVATYREWLRVHGHLKEIMRYKMEAECVEFKHWKDVQQEVKNNIADTIMLAWDIDDNDRTRNIIWKIAQERYKGWRQNSTNCKQMKVVHVMGSKPFSQCSWEMRDKEIGAKPIDLELSKATRTKQETGQMTCPRVSIRMRPGNCR